MGALVFGAMAERYGRIRSAAGATALMSVMSLACALAGNFPALLMLRLVQGIGVGGEMPVAAVYINELSKAKGRGRFFLLYEMIFPVGLMMTGQIGAFVVPTLGWQVMFLIGAIPGLVIAALLLRLRESPRWLIGKGRLEEAEAIIREIEASAPDAGTTKDTTATKDTSEIKRSFVIFVIFVNFVVRLGGASCSRPSISDARSSSGCCGRARTSSPTASTTGCRRCTTACTV